MATVKITRSLIGRSCASAADRVVILAARIGSPLPEHKHLLQTLSVIGRVSSFGLLARVDLHSDTQLERMLSDLRGSEFIYEQPIATGVEYVFKHALTQEVAYNSLLIERRKKLHEDAGRALESLFAEQLDDHLTQLAHHYSHGDNIEKAVEYLGRAGQQALRRSAYADAISDLNVLANTCCGGCRTAPSVFIYTGPAVGTWVSVDPSEGLGGAGSGASFYSRTGAVRASGRPSGAFPGLVWAVDHVLYSSGVTHGLRAWRTASAASAGSAQAGALVVSASR